MRLPTEPFSTISDTAAEPKAQTGKATIVELIRSLNQAAGLTSIVVTYDVQEALKVADYVYVIGDGVILGKGTSEEVAHSEDPYLHQFVNALPDGPVRFHFPGPPLEEDLHLHG